MIKCQPYNIEHVGRRSVKQGPRHQLENRGWENLFSDRGVQSATGGGGVDAGGRGEKTGNIISQLQHNV